MAEPLPRPSVPVADAFTQEYLAFYRFLPVALAHGRLRVAVAGTPCREALDDLKETYGAELELFQVDDDALAAGIRLTFDPADSIDELAQSLASEGGDPDRSESAPTDVRALANEPPVVRFVNLLIREASTANASDIHLEATREGLRARLRIDGVLSDLTAPPPALHAAIVSRIKLLAELDIAERRQPQDGRIRVRLDQRELDLRVATVPTVFGESVVLRLLDRGGRPVGLDELGLAADDLGSFTGLARRPHGILVATGPTGSGKTTSLYAALALRDATQEKIITVEDPVEYHLERVSQVPVQVKAGVTFASALRSILRQDPDVLMIGEMRDRETAAIAVQAAMTGHLVFSTLHTNDAISAIGRLADLGVEPYMIAATVEAVLAQRLVRRICGSCAERYRVGPEAIALLAERPSTAELFHRGAGCAECRHTGYRGRVGIFELLRFTEEVKDAVARRAGTAQLRDLARRQGMTTLRQDGLRKARAGITTIEEVHRVTQG
ncbi:MAG: type II/IV secretion system protein [Gemmatimonadales bacterium]|nr:type II/IV secretion system protein [Gemmatimonadales bacterium]